MADKLYPTEEQLDALREFSKKHGRNWKATLKTMWMNGADASQPNGHLLRQLRNQFGPRWLNALRLEAKE